MKIIKDIIIILSKIKITLLNNKDLIFKAKKIIKYFLFIFYLLQKNNLIFLIRYIA